ncbi:hypothetical protein QGM71_08540 [Virgibacillus sp. C22-A2]|uniref:Uncharacterized protein n=1 Tax=Virgibacillus tibetensis TaxID=3042313 RepID=A0ABU6KE19_9BACI|nr:hypothetical protein [Virgibacillus sp. C22-A2]
MKACSHTQDSIFEVMKNEDNLITVQDIHGRQVYQIADFPVKNIQPGILLQGDIGIAKHEFF